jgi:hypothetical protein
MVMKSKFMESIIELGAWAGTGLFFFMMIKLIEGIL